MGGTATCWHLVTGEYPPDPGGVSDYTAALARALVIAGQTVQVWCPGDAGGPVTEPDGVVVHRIAGRFGPAGLMRLDGALDRFPGPRTILIQYVPHAFGWRAMNLPFVLWAWGRARRGDDVRVMFHEVAFPWVRRPLRHNAIAATNRLMATLLVRACTQAYVSTAAWVPRLRRLGARRLPVAWTPVPASVPAEVSEAAVALRRAELTRGDPAVRVVGHFGTYGPPITRTLAPTLCELIGRRPDVRVLLLGSGGDRWWRTLAAERGGWIERIDAPGALPAPAIAESLRACDLVLQPYPDGASGRRTTLMAALANGVSVVTTVGDLSEAVWSEGAVAAGAAGDSACLVRLVLELLDSPDRRTALGQAGRKLYEERFAIGRTIDRLLQQAGSSAACVPGVLS
jgi:glycosyltransferase involved in cell wall biosynthesis